MRKLWLLGILLCSCGTLNTSKTNYKEYTNVGATYMHNLTYIVECEDKEYTLDISEVYYAKRIDTRIYNKFYLGNPNRLVIYVDFK